MTLEELNDFELGVVKGEQAIANDIPEDEVLKDEPNLQIRKGVRFAFRRKLTETFDSADSLLSSIIEYRKNRNVQNYFALSDSVLDVRDSANRERYRIVKEDNGEAFIAEHYESSDLEEALKRLDEDSGLELINNDDGSVDLKKKKDSASQVFDSAEYTLDKVNNDHYKVLKEGVPTYDLVKKQSRWTCSCPGFKYRNSCRHLSLLADVLPKRHPRSELEAFVPDIEKLFEGFPKWEIVGSYRRNSSDFKDVDIIVECTVSDFTKLLDRIKQDPSYEHTMAGNDIIRGKYHGYDLDISRVIPGEWGSFLLYRTGSANFNMKMRSLAKSLGMALNEHGLFDRESGKLIANSSEEDIFNSLGMDFVNPEDRK